MVSVTQLEGLFDYLRLLNAYAVPNIEMFLTSIKIEKLKIKIIFKKYFKI